MWPRQGYDQSYLSNVYKKSVKLSKCCKTIFAFLDCFFNAAFALLIQLPIFTNCCILRAFEQDGQRIREHDQGMEASEYCFISKPLHFLGPLFENVPSINNYLF